MKCALAISNVLKEISSLSHLLFPFISLQCSGEKAFLYHLAIVWNSAFIWVYFLLSLSLFFFSHLSYLYKISPDNHLTFLHFFFFRMVLVTTSCTKLRTSVHSSSGTLPIRSNPCNLSLPLCNHKGFYLGHV